MRLGILERRHWTAKDAEERREQAKRQRQSEPETRRGSEHLTAHGPARGQRRGPGVQPEIGVGQWGEQMGYRDADANTEDRSASSEQHRFRQQLPKQTRAPSAQGHAYRNLTPSC